MTAITEAQATALPNERGRERIRRAFEREELYGLRQWLRARLAVLVVIGTWMLFINPPGWAAYYIGIVLLSGMFGVAHYEIRKHGFGGALAPYAFQLLDVALVGFAIFVPNVFQERILPYGAILGFGNEHYFYIFLVASLFTYSPRIVLWTGFCTAIVYAAGVAWILSQPGSFILSVPNQEFMALSMDERNRLMGDLNRIALDEHAQTIILMLIVSAMLALGVWRVQRLVLANAVAERARANLSRHFSPNMVDMLANTDQPLGASRSQEAAVLFADIRGFTSYAETHAPEEALALLREVHSRFAQHVFAHGGTLDKYLGDGIMATFGTPSPGPRDAANALAAGRAILESIAAWNQTRIARGADPVHVGIGLHHGRVILGDIGDEQRIEYAVIGDTVNVASRIQDLTRKLDVRLAASQALVTAAREAGDGPELLQDMQRAPLQRLDGREEPILVWTLE